MEVQGWDVAGVVDATRDHRLTRKCGISHGNCGDWALSAGTDSGSSQWEVSHSVPPSMTLTHTSQGGGVPLLADCHPQPLSPSPSPSPGFRLVPLAPVHQPALCLLAASAPPSTAAAIAPTSHAARAQLPASGSDWGAPNAAATATAAAAASTPLAAATLAATALATAFVSAAFSTATLFMAFAPNETTSHTKKRERRIALHGYRRAHTSRQR